MKKALDTNQQKGAVVALFAVMLPAFIGALGLAVDTGATYEQNRRMQTAADAAALAAAQEVRGENWGGVENAAYSGARQNGFEPSSDATIGIEVHRPPSTGAFKGNNEYVEVIVTQPQPLYFMRLFKEEPDDIRARAVAGTQPSDTCVLVKNPSARNAFDVGGNATVRLQDCGVTVNSSNSQAAIANGSSIMEASHITIVGGYSGPNFNPEPFTGADVLDDPLASFTMPALGACTFSEKQIIMTSTTLNPGNYCGGIELRSQAHVTFNPGVYYLIGGGLNANAGARMTGTGVTFVNTEKKPTYRYDPIWINGGANISLSAPTSGPWQGILFYQDPKIVSTKTNIFNGGADMVLKGIVYFPTTSTKFSGDFGTDAQQLLMIGDKVEFTGNTTFKALPKEFLPRTLLAARVVE
jgi:hypothetical protein